MMRKIGAAGYADKDDRQHHGDSYRRDHQQSAIGFTNQFHDSESFRRLASRPPIESQPSAVEIAAPRERVGSRNSSVTSAASLGSSTSSAPFSSGRIASCRLP